MAILPIYYELEGRLVVVVGGGAVALHRAGVALDAGARVLVVAPTIDQRLVARAQVTDRLSLLTQSFDEPALEGAAMVFSCTDDPLTESRVVAAAAALGLPAIAARSQAGAATSLGAVLRQGPLVIGISTGGAAPSLSGYLRAVLERSIGSHYGDAASLMASLRGELGARVSSEAARRRFWSDLLSGDFLGLLESGRTSDAEAVARGLLDGVIAAGESGAD